MLSFPEIIVILLVAVVIFGPKRLPEVARKVGKWTGVLRRTSDEFKRQLMMMDQVVDNHISSATQDLDTLAPEGEDLEKTLSEAFDPSLPPMRTDELGEPVPGGLPPEPSVEGATVDATMAASPETIPTDASTTTEEATPVQMPPAHESTIEPVSETQPVESK